MDNKYSVWLVVVEWAPDGTIKNLSRRFSFGKDRLDETQANMVNVAVSNFVNKTLGISARDDYAQLNMWEKAAETPPKPGDKTGTVIATVLNVRDGPGVGHKVVGQLKYGDEVSVWGETNTGGSIWYKIGQGLWVHGGWVNVGIG